ncbi:MAG: fused MFS/spermidine synthase [Caldilineaceae bacterium]|nr:fused MFS/spermidine synthase [Caldilineaceae bacterium]
MAPVGVHFITVTKEGSRLRLWLLEQVRPSSGVIQSEMDLDDPLSLVDPYSQAAMLALLWNPKPKRIYFAGFGAGRVPMILHHYFPQATIDCAEIEPTVVTVAERFFGAKLDNRLRVQIEDGRVWLAQHEGHFDMMMVDVFLDNGYSPYRLSTVEFYELCRDRLTPDGVLIVNMLAEDSYLAERLQSLGRVFKTIYVCPIQEENNVVIAHNCGEVEQESLVDKAAALQGIHRFNFPFARHIPSLSSDLRSIAPTLEEAYPFMDDAPPEGYFDSLPSFNTPFSRVDAKLPCPCGSGRKFGDCHGLPARSK